MKLVSLTVENFRSITSARKIPISQMTTLIGPNNEGKSNILRALAIAMTSLLTHRRVSGVPARRRYVTPPRMRRRPRNYHQYNWYSDYPLPLQNRNSAKKSTIILEFELTQPEIEAFRAKIGSRLNGTLPIGFSFDRDGQYLSIAKQGRGHKVLNSKASAIADFVAARLNVLYIPAVRTADAEQAIVEELVAEELSKIEDDARYIQALEDIATLQQPILDTLAASIADTMKIFLPQIANVKLSIEQQDRSFALRAIPEVLIDDGVETQLEYKGDGVQSLAAVAIMRHASLTSHRGKEIIVALEEPESHLHPTAIRELRVVLRDLAERHQVVLSTHNPLFTDRENVGHNVIVNKNRAFPAATVKDVRSVLGVRVEDNLSSAEVILLVEGEEDKLALSAILKNRSELVRREIASGRCAIDVLGGTGNLAYRVRLHSESLCRIHAFLDGDVAGQEAFEKARAEGLLELGDVNFARCGGKREAELEDLYSEDLYDDIIEGETGLRFGRQGPDKGRKWTDRLRNLLRRAGKPTDQSSINPIKLKVARVAAEQGWNALHQAKTGPLESLATSLERKLRLV